MPTKNQLLVELWASGKVIGWVYIQGPLDGKYVPFQIMPSPLKQEYGRKYETIVVPIVYHLLSDDGVNTHFRRRLDVSKKSERQIKLIQEFSKTDVY